MRWLGCNEVKDPNRGPESKSEWCCSKCNAKNNMLKTSAQTSFTKNEMQKKLRGEVGESLRSSSWEQNGSGNLSLVWF